MEVLNELLGKVDEFVWGPVMILLLVIWTLADISNALMAIPNLIGLILLSGVVTHEAKNYFKRLKDGEFNVIKGVK